MYIHVLFGSIAFETFNISGGLPLASHKRLSGFWPIFLTKLMLPSHVCSLPCWHTQFCQFFTHFLKIWFEVSILEYSFFTP